MNFESTCGPPRLGLPQNGSVAGGGPEAALPDRHDNLSRSEALCSMRPWRKPWHCGVAVGAMTSGGPDPVGTGMRGAADRLSSRPICCGPGSEPHAPDPQRVRGAFFADGSPSRHRCRAALTFRLAVVMHAALAKRWTLRIVIIDDSGARATVLEEGLREAGYDDIHLVPPQGAFVARLERMAPDVVLMDLGNPSRDTLEEMLTVSRALAKPIAMFVDRSDDSMIGAAIEAGVSAYVVDGLRKERVKPILDLAIRRFNAFARIQAELDAARTQLADRKTIDRAKAILMATRGLSEPDAYALLRTAAMNQGKKMVDVAAALITASDLLGGTS